MTVLNFVLVKKVLKLIPNENYSSQRQFCLKPSKVWKLVEPVFTSKVRKLVLDENLWLHSAVTELQIFFYKYNFVFFTKFTKSPNRRKGVFTGFPFVGWLTTGAQFTKINVDKPGNNVVYEKLAAHENLKVLHLNQLFVLLDINSLTLSFSHFLSTSPSPSSHPD